MNVDFDLKNVDWSDWRMKSWMKFELVVALQRRETGVGERGMTIAFSRREMNIVF